MRLPYQTLKKIEWRNILMTVAIILLAFSLFSKDEVVVTGYSQEDVDYKIKIHDLEKEIQEKQQEYEILETHVSEFKAQLDSNHAFFGSATDAQVDSSFAVYFGM